MLKKRWIEFQIFVVIDQWFKMLLVVFYGDGHQIDLYKKVYGIYSISSVLLCLF